MPRFLAFMLLLAGFGSVQAASNEIDSFIKGFDAMSLNGIWPGVELPADASVAKVVEVFAASQKKTTDADQYKGYRIVETRKLDREIGFGLGGKTVVFISSSRGSKTILLLSNFGGGWNIRPYFITTVP